MVIFYALVAMGNSPFGLIDIPLFCAGGWLMRHSVQTHEQADILEVLPRPILGLGMLAGVFQAAGFAVLGSVLPACVDMLEEQTSVA